jgi:hypothetical protein
MTESGKDLLKTTNDLSPAIQSLVDEIAAIGTAGDLMTEFGLSAGEAMDAAKILAKDGIKKSREEVVKLVKDLSTARKEFDDSVRAVEAHEQSLADLQSAYDVRNAVVDFGVDTATATEAVRLAADANIDLAAALDLVAEKRNVQASIEFESSGGFLGVPSDAELERLSAGMALWDTGKTRIDSYRDEVNKLWEEFDNGEITEQQLDNGLAALDGQMEGWELLGARVKEIGEEVGGVWGGMIEGIGENLDRIGGVLGEAAQMAFARGEQQTGHILNFASSAAQGNVSGMLMSGVAATGFGQQSISQFGGRGEGNFVQEGMQLGSAFGPWGTLVGGVVGAFVKKGADDFQSHMSEVAGEASLIITQAEGKLGEVGQQIKGTVDGTLNAIQDMIGADLNFALQGFEIDIRGDEVTVMANGITQTFKDLDKVIDFFIHGIIDAQGQLAGLGPNMEAALNQISSTSTATGDTDRLMKALALASELDAEMTGVNQAAIAARREELEIARDFGIPFENVIALRNKELDIAKRSLVAQAAGLTDFAGGLADLSHQLNSVNNTVDASIEIDLARKAEIEAQLEAQNSNNRAIGDSTTALNQQTLSLQQQTGMTDEQAAAHQAATQAASQYGQSTQFVTSTYTGGLHPAQQYGQAMLDESESRNSAILTSRQLQAELDAIEASLAGIPSGFDPAEIQRSVNAQASGAVTSITGMLLSMVERGFVDLSVEEKIALQEQLFEMERVRNIAQLYATQTQLEAMIALGQVSGATAEALQSLLASIPGMIGQVLGAEFKPGRMGGGGQRRQAREQAQREAEQAEEKRTQALLDFNDRLRTLTLNASNAAGTLGDLANRLDDIRERAQEAIDAGADPADVRQAARLEFRDERRRVTDPFDAAGPQSFRDSTVDIEQQRRAALDEARMIAAAQAEALGVPFEVIFEAMEKKINSGAKKMERALTRGLIESLGLPLEDVRKSNRELRKQLKDLDQARKEGNISQRRYKMLIEQISDAHEAALSGDVLALLDTYYGDIEGKEELRQNMEMANFELQLAMARLRFETLKSEGVLMGAALDNIEGFLTYMEENPPDWEAFFATPEGGGAGILSGSSRGGFSGSSTTAAGGVNLDGPIRSIRNFVDGFSAIDLGRFESMANDYLTTVSGFRDDLRLELDTVLSSGFTLGGHALKTARNFLRQATGDMGLEISSLQDLTEEQLRMLADADLSQVSGFFSGVEDVFETILGIQDAEELKPKAIRNLLDSYKQLPAEASSLAGELRDVNDDFLDIVAGLELLGASESELFEARMEYTRQLHELEEQALGDIRQVGKDIRGGVVFGTATAQQRVRLAEENLAELQARAEAGDLGAVEGLAAAMREVIAARQEFTGGAGPEFTLALERIAQLAETFDLDLGGGPSPQEQMLDLAAEQLERMDLADVHFLQANAATQAQISAQISATEATEAATMATGEKIAQAIKEASESTTQESARQIAALEDLMNTVVETSALTRKLMEEQGARGQ